MSGYSRQSSYENGDVIMAEDSNDEFNTIAAAFAAQTGHKHDGTPGEGGYISALSDEDNDTKITIGESAATQNEITFYAGGTHVGSFTRYGFEFGGRFRMKYNPITDTLDFEVI